jgi:hypothetical protein
MLKIENNNCNSLLLNSEDIQDVIKHPENYSSLSIEATINGCKQIYTNQCSLLNCSRFYLKLFPNCCNLTIKNITFENISTGTEFSIADTTNYISGFTSILIQDCGDFNQLTTKLKEFFHYNFGINISTALTGTCNFNSIDNYFTYTIENLPSNIVVKNIQYLLDGVEINEPFEIQNNLTFSVTTEGIELFPNFFGQETLTDGIYSINTKIVTKNFIEISDSTCYFVDCNTQCRLTEKLEGLKENKDKMDLLMIHYALINNSNCGCNCTEMIELFKQLDKELELEVPKQPINNSGNGCSTC